MGLTQADADFLEAPENGAQICVALSSCMGTITTSLAGIGDVKRTVEKTSLGEDHFGLWCDHHVF